MKTHLETTKSLFNITKNILDDKNSYKYQFLLPSSLSRIEQRAVDSHRPVILYRGNIFLEKAAFYCLIKRSTRNNKCLFIVDDGLLYEILKRRFQNERPLFCKSKDIHIQEFSLYDEIILFCDLSLKELLNMKSKNKNISFLTNKKEYIDYFPDNEIFELDEVILPSFEIFDFVRQFVPNNLRWNNKDFLNRLEQRNSGADKPIVYEVNSFEEEIGIINDIIDENPFTNIVILLPFAKDEDNFDLSVEKYYQILRKNNSLTKYYLGINVFKLSNIIVTTFDDIKYIDFDIVVIPQFNKIKEIVNNEKIFISICSAKNQLHLL